MFEKTSELAERLVISISRRRFLGALGGWGATAALGVATVLTGPTAARGGSSQSCCYYAACSGCAFPNTNGTTCKLGGNSVSICTIFITQPGVSCPATYGGCPLVFSSKPTFGGGCKC
jgi:hypothetical protein